jgi:hypothetical protein
MSLIFLHIEINLPKGVKSIAVSIYAAQCKLCNSSTVCLFNSNILYTAEIGDGVFGNVA